MVRKSHPRYLVQVVDFVVLGLTFFLTCVLLSVDLSIPLFVQTLAYATILVVFVRLARRWFVRSQPSINILTRQIVGNAAGILGGTCVMLLLQKLLAGSGDLFVVLVFSGIMAFFILGTLSPLINNNRSSSVS